MLDLVDDPPEGWDFSLIREAAALLKYGGSIPDDVGAMTLLEWCEAVNEAIDFDTLEEVETWT